MTARLLLMPVFKSVELKARALGEGGLGVEGDDRRDGEQRTKAFANGLFHGCARVFGFHFLWRHKLPITRTGLALPSAGFVQ